MYLLTYASLLIGTNVRADSLRIEYAPNAFTKSGKRKISTMAKPVSVVDVYLPAVTSMIS